ncbi:hypothetical protein ACHAWF_003265 [Thalassiosira exigua]
MVRRASTTVLLLAALRGASGFAPPASPRRTRSTGGALAAFDGRRDDAVERPSFDPLRLAESDDSPRSSSSSPTPAVLAAFSAALLSPLSASAAGPDWGIFEGRTGSLLHPLAMFSMAALSASTALLGFQWRRQRTLGDEISSLKKSLPDLMGASSAKAALAEAEGAEERDAGRIATLRGALGIESQIEELQKERKELAGAGPRDKHFNQGALLLFVGTAFAIEGPLNTYARAGKLFPGPHLYAGAGLVCLWALAASMVPAMQKGNDAARTVHIGANLAGIGLFAWQVTSGIPILFKVLEFTKWP